MKKISLFLVILLFAACKPKEPPKPVQPVEADSIVLDTDLLHMDTEDTYTLHATILPDNTTDKSVVWTSHNPDIADVASNGTITAITAGTTSVVATTANGKTALCTVIVKDKSLTHDEGVVINGIKWATRNVDRPGTFDSAPESYGMFYQWNRKVGWYHYDPLENSDGGTEWDTTMPEGTEWEAANDPCPQGWRVPTAGEFRTLLNTDNVSSTYPYFINGIQGYLFTDLETEDTLFIPNAGRRDAEEGRFPSYGAAFFVYWSSTQYDDTHAWYFNGWAVSNSYYGQSDNRNGCSVRCVQN